MKKEIIRFGRKLVSSGLNYSHFGNISVRRNNKILISVKGSMLDELSAGDIVETGLIAGELRDRSASIELIVHRNIYLNTTSRAIIHVHSPFAIVQSIIAKEKKIIPVDDEGGYFFNKIPIIEGKSGSKTLAENAAAALKNHQGVIIKGHGSIAVGESLPEAYLVISSIEHICKIKYYVDYGKDISV